jgi:hypothetical protein
MPVDEHGLDEETSAKVQALAKKHAKFMSNNAKFIAEYFYGQGFIHGYKHGEEDTLERIG